MTAKPASEVPASEVKVVASLALLYAFRMLGLFMVLPVLMLYGTDYAGSTPFLLGLALGIYGLTQACFQIPLGFLSDKWGRKPIIVAGLLLFAGGSVLAAVADSVAGLILGRALQGAGAIASAVMALVSDLTSEQHRTKAMAAIGGSIGLSFAAALILGPLLAGMGGLATVFWVSGGLALVGLLIMLFVVPTSPVAGKDPAALSPEAAAKGRLNRVLQHPELLRLDWGILSLHFVLMASFVAVPGMLEQLGFSRAGHWQIYLPVMGLGFVVMLPVMIYAERRRQVKPVFLGAVLVLALAYMGLFFWHLALVPALVLLFIFFTGFNLLEAQLPSLVSRHAPADTKGTAMGIYSTSQFLGAFGGGTAGGLVMQLSGSGGVFLLCALVALAWLLVALAMKPPRTLANLQLTLPEGECPLDRVRDLPGVVGVTFVEDERRLYLRVDQEILDYQRLLLLTGASDGGPAVPQ